VLGSGSGSEIIGSLAAGCHVVAFELDPFQFNLSKARVEYHLNIHQTLLEKHKAVDEDFDVCHLLCPLSAFSMADASVSHAHPDAPDPATPDTIQEYLAREMVIDPDAVPEPPPVQYRCYVCAFATEDISFVLRCMACRAMMCVMCYGEDNVGDHVCRTCSSECDDIELAAIRQKPIATACQPGANHDPLEDVELQLEDD
jgi:hypothetical protein